MTDSGANFVPRSNQLTGNYWRSLAHSDGADSASQPTCTWRLKRAPSLFHSCRQNRIDTARASPQLNSDPNKKYSVTSSIRRAPCGGAPDSIEAVEERSPKLRNSGNLIMLFAEITSAAAVGSPERAKPKMSTRSMGPINLPP